MNHRFVSITSIAVALPAALNTAGTVAFPYYSPFGFNGRYLYARVGVEW